MDEDTIQIRREDLAAMIEEAVEKAIAAREQDPELEARKLQAADEAAASEEARIAAMLENMGTVTIRPAEGIRLWWNGHLCELKAGEDNEVPAVFEGVYRDHTAQQARYEELQRAMMAELQAKRANPALVDRWS